MFECLNDPPPNGGTCSTLNCTNLSVGRRYTLARLSEAYRDTLDSSVQSTSAQSSAVQWMCSRANASRAFGYALVSGGPMAGLRCR